MEVDRGKNALKNKNETNMCFMLLLKFYLVARKRDMYSIHGTAQGL